MNRGILHLLRPYTGSMLVALGAVAVGGLADILEPWPLKIALDSVLGAKQLPAWLASDLAYLTSDARRAAMVAAVLLIAGVAALAAVSSYVERYLTTSVSQRVTRDLRHLLYHHLEHLSLSYFDHAKLGELLSRLTTDVDAVQDLVSDAVLGVVSDVMTICGMLAVMFYLDWRFALVGIAVMPALALTAFGFTARIKKATRAVRTKQSEIVSVIEESLSSIRVVQAYAREEYEELRLDRAGNETVDLALRARLAKSVLSGLVEIIIAVGTGVVFWFGLQRVLAGHLTAGALVVFLSYLGKMYKPLRDLAKMADTLSKAAVGLERIDEVLSTEGQVRDAAGAIPAPRFAGVLDFEHVAFAYEEGKPVLRDVNLSIAKGQTAAIVGPSGSGKSTLAQLIPRLYDATGGTVRIDGEDVHRYTLGSLRAQVGLVLQDSVLFHASLWENIAYGRPRASREQILRAAKIANVHEFVAALPDGYDTLLGDRGMTLSGGQRQRVAIARAVVRDSPVLILDEPTSGLDSTSERVVLEALARLMDGRTSLLITHRLEMLDLADVIFVIEGGTIVERGTRRELVEKGGVFSELYSAYSHE